MTTPQVGSYFIATAPDVYTPTVHAGGAWSDDDLHFSPVAGLLIHHMDTWRAAHTDPDKIIGRVTFDILGRLPRADIELQTRIIRAGRTIELLETTATIGGRLTLSARAWALSVGDTRSVADGEWAPLPKPENLEPYILTDIWPGGYINSVDVRKAGPTRPGRATAWVTTRLQLVEGEQAGTLASYTALIDTANGIAVRQHPEDWMFPNLDLTVHLFRQPEGHWVGLDTTVAFGHSGQGLSSSILHDTSGPVGTAQQILTVRPNPEGTA